MQFLLWTIVCDQLGWLEAPIVCLPKFVNRTLYIHCLRSINAMSEEGAMGFHISLLAYDSNLKKKRLG